MRAAVFHGKGDIRYETVPDPSPAPGELLLEVHGVGICGTDSHEFAAGPSLYSIDAPHPVTGHVGPLIPGHELTGRVVAVGAGVDGIELGTIVASGAGIWCGSCRRCRAGRTNLCERYSTVGLQRHGGLAQFCALPAMTCRSIEPYGLTEDAATLAQPMAIGVHAMRRGRLQPGEHAVVIGAGGIGMFLSHAAVQEGATVAVIDLDAGRLAVAERLGASFTHVPVGDNIGQVLASHAIFPDVVYEVSGSAAGMATALDLIGLGGRLVLVGLHDRQFETDAKHLTLSEIEVIGTNAHVCDADLPRALELLAVRDDPWSDIAPRALPLELLVEQGLGPMVDGTSPEIKTLIDPWAAEIRPTAMV